MEIKEICHEFPPKRMYGFVTRQRGSADVIV